MREESLRNGMNLKADVDVLGDFIKSLEFFDSDSPTKRAGFFGLFQKQFPLSVLEVNKNTISIDPLTLPKISLSLGDIKSNFLRKEFVKTRSKIFKNMLYELQELKRKAEEEFKQI